MRNRRRTHLSLESDDYRFFAEYIKEIFKPSSSNHMMISRNNGFVSDGTGLVWFTVIITHFSEMNIVIMKDAVRSSCY